MDEIARRAGVARSTATSTRQPGRASAGVSPGDVLAAPRGHATHGSRRTLPASPGTPHQEMLAIVDDSRRSSAWPWSPRARRRGRRGPRTELALIGLDIARLLTTWSRRVLVRGDFRPLDPRPGHRPDRPADLRRHGGTGRRAQRPATPQRRRPTRSSSSCTACRPEPHPTCRPEHARPGGLSHARPGGLRPRLPGGSSA